ncbi:MAG: ATP-binding protein [Bdellovibrionota bacterium]
MADFSALRPGAQLIRMSYMVLMVLMTLLIIFAATWMGFYVARGITGPIQSLAEATREVALGNYAVTLEARTDDETGQLVKSFNLMTRDLEKHRLLTERTQKDLKRSNIELDQRRQYMEIVLKNITGGVLSIDKSGTITSINRAAERLLEIDSKTIDGLKVEDGLGDLYQNFWLPVWEELREHATFHGQLDIYVGGAETTLVVDAVTIADENNVEVGYVLVFDDAKEKARIQRVAAWREVARRIAHEIKNPITPIKLNAQRLLRRFHKKFTGEDHDIFVSCIEIIVKQVDSLRDLVNEFSKFSKLPDVELSMGDLNVVIEEMIDLFSLGHPEIQLNKVGLQPLPKIPIDRDQMGRALLNIVANSVSALEEGRPGQISFKSEYIKSLKIVRLEISDNGCGIPNGLKGRVLEPYFSTKDEGTGLGLAIVNQIITDHGGYLRLVDNHPYGTTAVIELPSGTVQST